MKLLLRLFVAAGLAGCIWLAYSVVANSTEQTVDQPYKDGSRDPERSGQPREN